MKKFFNAAREKIFFERIRNSIKKEKKLGIVKVINWDFINSVGIKIMLQITLLLVCVCGILGAVSYENSYKALEDTISSQLQSRAMEASNLINSTLQQVIQRFSELSTKIYMSVEDISENMKTLSSSVSSCTEASIDISGNINEISEENERITGKSIENAEGADTLLMLVSEFKIK